MRRVAMANANSGRALALARRKAMSGSGKTALSGGSAQASQSGGASSAPAQSSEAGRPNAPGGSARLASRARRKALSTHGKSSAGAKDRTRSADDRGGSSARAESSAPSRAARPARASRSSSKVSASGSARQASMARRRALSARGKPSTDSKDRTRSADGHRAASPAVEAEVTTLASEKKRDCGCGCGGQSKGARNDGERSSSAVRARPRNGGRRPVVQTNPSKAAALARRKAQSSRGKAGVSRNGMSEAQTARAVNPQLSGRELAQALRDQRSRRGSAGQKKSAPTGRQRKARDNKVGAAHDAPWKVGASETGRGQTVTGTMVGRDKVVTGDEPSTCRDITGTEYLGADIFREFCQAEPARTPMRGGSSATNRGNTITGNEVGRSERVTGDESGTCKRVTGSEYLSAGQSEAYCGSRPEASPMRQSRAETLRGKTVTGDNVGRSGKVTGDEAGAERALTGSQYMQSGEAGAPPKVGASQTLRGGAVTGSLVGRSNKMTGDEPGSCRNVTGDDYVGQEQFGEFCGQTPKPTDNKVGVSSTLGGESVTGTMTDRTGKVTGSEPGTCKAITGTPYAGSEQYAGHCDTSDANQSAARMAPSRRTFGMPMTGQQPGVGGGTTGDAKGACETVSGTPYVGNDQAAAACPAQASEPGGADYPQALEAAPWTDFSVTPPAHATDARGNVSAVTGSQYEQGQITGPFDMAAGKVTGTEQARFDRNASPATVAPPVEQIDGRVKSRITGEGMDAGAKITGDDWDRGDHVTGTEGASSKRRNPTLRGGPMAAMGARAREAAEAPDPVSKVTGGSGNTEKGAMITYSGGARG